MWYRLQSVHLSPVLLQFHRITNTSNKDIWRCCDSIWPSYPRARSRELRRVEERNMKNTKEGETAKKGAKKTRKRTKRRRSGSHFTDAWRGGGEEDGGKPTKRVREKRAEWIPESDIHREEANIRSMYLELYSDTCIVRTIQQPFRWEIKRSDLFISQSATYSAKIQNNNGHRFSLRLHILHCNETRSVYPERIL